MSRDESHRPLIDLIHDRDLDVSDEEDTFYVQDDRDHLLSPEWRAMITKTTNRIPRRLQRYFALYSIAIIIVFIGWRIYIGPQVAAYKKEQVDMDSAAKMEPVKTITPAFTDLVQLKDLDKKHLPKGEGRLVIVGDVHGCKKELIALLDKVDFSQENDHLILTGDIVAKGPDSPGVVALASRIGASCVRGNHEDKVLLSLQETADYHDPNISRPDVDSIGYSVDEEENDPSRSSTTLQSLAKTFTEPQITYLRSCPVILRVGQIGELHNVVVVHAGLTPDIPLERQDPFQVMNMRTIDLKTLLPSETRKHTPWEKYWNHQQESKPENERTTVIYGHDKKRGKNIKKYSMGLDSGCVSGGHLTAMVISEGGKHEYVHVKCKGYID